jgi:hypothetical protein
MLDIARRKRDAVGLTDRELKLVHADVLKLDLKRKFDSVAIFFNTFLGFTTLAEQDRFFRSFDEHLRPRPRGALLARHLPAEPSADGADISRGIDPACSSFRR